jgi:hypothetical protein
VKAPITNKREFLVEANRINAKLSATIDGEKSYPTLYALLALAVHCANESNVPNDEALSIFRKLLEIRKPSAKG